MLSDLLKRHAVDRPRQVALVEGSSRLTWSELDGRVSRLASGLWNEGVRQGDAVGLVLPNSCAFVATLLAAGRIGAVAVPVNPELTALETRAVLESSGCRTAVFAAEVAELCQQWRGDDEIRTALVEGMGRPGIPGLDQWRSGPLDCCNLPVPGEESQLMQMMTSGTTGPPRRIVRTHGQVMSLAHAYQSAVDGSPDDRILAVIPMSHGHGFCSCLLAALQSGATLFVQRSFDRRAALQVLSRERITVFSAVPFVFSVLADTTMARPVDLSAMRFSVTGGAPLRRETWVKVRDRLGMRIRQSYGSVETGALTINMDPDPDATSDSVGRPLPGMHVRILDDAGNSLPSGMKGEVAVQSPCAGETCEADDGRALIPVDGWLRMNDLGWLDDEGRLYITGRKTSIINVAGKKVVPGEVETVLSHHPAVRQVVVIPHRDAYGEEAVRALVVRDEKCTVTELVKHCRAQLAAYKVPRFVEFRDSLP
jgi:long-chain acyl-CoA synthetase